MKIFAIGMNYAAHNQELHGTLKRPDEPVIFTKADSAILNQGKPFFIPDHLGRIDYETEVVVRICRLGKNISERFTHRYYDAVTVGIDFTARDLQKRRARQDSLGPSARVSTAQRQSESGCPRRSSSTYRAYTSTLTLTARRCNRVAQATCSTRLTRL